MLKWKGLWKHFDDQVNTLLDLHLHTTYSDGEKTPERLLDELQANQVTHFSLTDHDNMAPFELIKRAALQRHMRTVPGIEMSSLYNGSEVHILGYRFDWKSPDLKAFIKERMDLRKERALLILKALEKKGFVFDDGDIERVISARYVGRPQIADLLVAYGYVETPGEAFCKELIGDNSSQAVTHQLKPAQEVIRIIKKAGGLVFLAHPGLFNTQDSRADGMNKYDLHRFVTFGIDGLEIFHPNHTKAQIQRYLSIAKRENLLISMGSDYHKGLYKVNPYACQQVRYLEDVLSWME